MTNRAANEALKGYFYQFDYTILQILSMDDDSECVVEGTEDIDISKANELNAIQCKYHESQAYQHSRIKKPIQLMLRDYSRRITNGLPTISYTLYGHFHSGQDKFALPLTVAFLKDKILSYTENGVLHKLHEDLSISDHGLERFIELLRIDITAKSYEDQLEETLSLFEKIFTCSRFEAENYYYNNALSLVRVLAIEPDIRKRTVNRQSFLQKIDKKELLFGMWFLKLRGEESYIREIKKEFFTRVNVGNKNRFFLIDVSRSCPIRSELKDLVEHISNMYSKLSEREANPFCPYVYFHGLSSLEYLALKDDLYKERFYFVDGHPYKGSGFRTDCIHMPLKHAKRIKIRIIEDIECLDASLESSAASTQVFQFFSDEAFYDTNDERIAHVKIQVDDLRMIRRII